MSGKITSKFREELRNQILKSEFNKYLTYRQTDEYNKSTDFLNCAVSGRIPKSKEIDFIEFKENLFSLAEELIGGDCFEKLEKIFEISFGSGIGDKYNNNPIEAFDLKGNKTLIKHEEGSVLLIDFWATWCKFCQEPMEENIIIAKELINSLDNNNNKIENENKKDLNNIIITGLSCDEDESKWKEHIKAKNWGIIQHYYKPNIHKALNLIKIPQIMIIGKDGIIKYLGIPRNIELKETLINVNKEKDILLKKEIFDNDSYDNNNNNQLNNQWNYELKDEEKKIIIKEINQMFTEKGINKVEIIIYTKSVMDKTGNMDFKTQVFLEGEIMAYENDIVFNCINFIESKYLLKNIVNNLKVIAMNIDEDF
jgi:thiol-disulfide isomerase/thioredoxin